MLDDTNPEYRAAVRKFDGVVEMYRAQADQVEEEYATKLEDLKKYDEAYERARAESERLNELRESSAKPAAGRPAEPDWDDDSESFEDHSWLR